MTIEEHKLMILMFTPLYAALDTLSEALISHGVWSRAEKTAFCQVPRADDAKLMECLARTTSDYLRCAAETGVATGIELGPPN